MPRTPLNTGTVRAAELGYARGVTAKQDLDRQVDARTRTGGLPRQRRAVPPPPQGASTVATREPGSAARDGRARSAILGCMSPPIRPSGAGADGPPGLGTVSVVLGPEELRRARAVGAIVAGVRASEPAAEVEVVDGASLTAGAVAGLTQPSLFSTSRVVVLQGADVLADEVATELVGLARAPDADCALVVIHPGGNRGRGVVDALRKIGTAVITCDRPKPREVPDFIAGEASLHRVRMDRLAAQRLADAVGMDLSALAAAVSQLAADLPEGAATITVEHVALYYGGVAEVSGFDVADAVFAGRTEQALASLRFALQANVAPVLLASAIATGARSLLRCHGLRRGLPESDVARLLGVPPWKVSGVRAQARSWGEDALGAAVEEAAALDSAVKGGTTDPGFALELAVLRIGALHG